MFEIEDVVANKIALAGADRWLRDLPALVESLAADWHFTVAGTLTGGTEALVLAVDRADGTPAVVKVWVPPSSSDPLIEIDVLERVAGDGCVPLLAADRARGAMMVERLGPSLNDLGVPYAERQRILTDLALRIWRPAADLGLPTGAAKAEWLRRMICETWETLDRPVSERAVDYALACADRREAAHDDERAVLVHGDIHEWNALRHGDGFALIDPDGLLAEPEYDLGVLLREDPLELLTDHPHERALWLAERTGCDAEATWEWGVVERMSTGLRCVEIDLQPIGSQMLAAAEHIVDHPWPSA